MGVYLAALPRLTAHGTVLECASPSPHQLHPRRGDYSSGLTGDFPLLQAFGRAAATQNGPVGGAEQGLLRVSHLVEEFITSLVYFPHKYTIQGGLRLLGHRRHANWVCAGNGSGSGPPSSGSEGPADSAAGRTQWKAELRGRAEERQHHSELRRTCLTRCSRAHRHERNPGGNSRRNHLHKNPQTCP